MLKHLLILSLGFSLQAFALVDSIHDDYTEEKTSNIHTFGLMVYGTHNNTFHLRQFFARYNHQFENVQFFLTLSGQKDTHDPDTNYTFNLGNVSLYDYGVYFNVYKGFFISPRAAATYRSNFKTHLLVPAYFFEGNSGEFDSPPDYRAVFLTGPGIRVGYAGENFEVGYSQGDFRHSIPIAVMAKYFRKNYFARALVQLHNEDPTVYNDNLWRGQAQLSLGADFSFPHGIGASALAEVTRTNQIWWIRLEQAFHYKKFTLAFRQIIQSNRSLLAEVSLLREITGVASAGIYAATDGRVYAATKISF